MNQERMIKLALTGIAAEQERLTAESELFKTQLRKLHAPAAPATRKPARKMRDRLSNAGRKKLSLMMKRRWAKARKSGQTSLMDKK